MSTRNKKTILAVAFVIGFAATLVMAPVARATTACTKANGCSNLGVEGLEYLAKNWAALIKSKCFTDIFIAQVPRDDMPAMLVTTMSPISFPISALMASVSGTGNLISSTNRTDTRQKLELIQRGAADAADFVANPTAMPSETLLAAATALLELKAEQYGIEEIDQAVNNDQISLSALATEIILIAEKS